MKNREVLYIAFIFVCFVALYNGYHTVNEYKAFALATTDTLVKTRNKLGQENTATAMLYSTVKDLKALHVADTTAIGKLQRMVNALTVSATYLQTVTKNNFTAAATVLPGDTVEKDSRVYIYPRYHTDSSTRWTRYNITASRDSFHIQFTTFNEYEIKQEWKRNGLFKRKTLEASVINLNPNTTTLKFQTFTVAENKGNRVRDILLGALAGSIATQASTGFIRKLK